MVYLETSELGFSFRFKRPINRLASCLNSCRLRLSSTWPQLRSNRFTRAPSHKERKPSTTEDTEGSISKPVQKPLLPVFDNNASLDTDGTPLPTGWVPCIDSANRKFYANNYTRTTLWKSKPTTLDLGDKNRNLKDLPTGWVTGVTTDSRICFVNRNTQTQSWTDPRSPPGWSKRFDEEGRPYFVDYNNLTATWDDPMQNMFATDPLDIFMRKILFFNRRNSIRIQEGASEISVRKSVIRKDTFAFLRKIQETPRASLRRYPRVTFKDDLDCKEPVQEWLDLVRDDLLQEDGPFEIDDTGSFKKLKRSLWTRILMVFCHKYGWLCGMAVFHGFFVDPRLASILHGDLTRISPVTERNPVNFGHTKILDPKDYLLLGFCNVVDRQMFEGYSLIELERLFGRVTTLQKEYCATYTMFDEKIEKRTDKDSMAVNGSSISSKSDIHLDWFWKIAGSWAPEEQRALFTYVTGSVRIPASDLIKVMKTPDGNIQRVTIPGKKVKREALPLRDIDVPQHILFIPPFENYEAMERALRSVVFDDDKAVGKTYLGYECM
ncbi:hypothetical protein JR316_0002460 [Psilocybe cubensis]|uniref:HECT-type E3 ubiquitin transferase n=2 Tax=Psilocybe cubensis TaxID=181762 RepID=A0A8H7Y523_PSICU|nr:hypothetical protein JR316_0002460 [Psilocybe cubensis]KAH9485550.1 hypothetical protein JR316_0002460 [Psilocybe cubensis]